MSKYNFKYQDMEFSKDGQLDELIVLDRYTIPSYDNYQKGDTVVAIVDKNLGTKRVGEIQNISGNNLTIKDRFDETHTLSKKLAHKPLETKPYQLWERWAKGATSVEETGELKRHWENEFRWLFDGFRYSLGGRIQLMLGQEYTTGKKANLTAYNCFVIRSPRPYENDVDQFQDVINVAHIEASIMRRGGGCGLNISPINTVNGTKRGKTDFNFILDESHLDYQELLDRQELGKFDNVTVNSPLKDSDIVITPDDSVDSLFEKLNALVYDSYHNYKRISLVFNKLRERDAIVKGVNGRSSGAVSWMELFVLVAELLQQDKIDNVDFAEIFSHIVHLIIQGGSRRGALMEVCNVDNPNVQKFITRKTKTKFLSGANISVGIDDHFMELVKNAKNGDTSDEASKAKETWDLIIKSAWQSAEPGVIFMERYNKESNSWYFHDIVATNPCGTR